MRSISDRYPWIDRSAVLRSQNAHGPHGTQFPCNARRQKKQGSRADEHAHLGWTIDRSADRGSQSLDIGCTESSVGDWATLWSSISDNSSNPLQSSTSHRVIAKPGIIWLILYIALLILEHIHALMLSFHIGFPLCRFHMGKHKSCSQKRILKKRNKI